MISIRPYKYEILAEEIVSYLKEQKKAGKKTETLCARDIERMFHVSARCGAKSPSRYPLICQAMGKVAEKYPVIWCSDVNPSSTFTAEYQLTLF